MKYATYYVMHQDHPRPVFIAMSDLRGHRVHAIIKRFEKMAIEGPSFLVFDNGEGVPAPAGGPEIRAFYFHDGKKQQFDSAKNLCHKINERLAVGGSSALYPLWEDLVDGRL
jgi:hypothetical protein